MSTIDPCFICVAKVQPCKAKHLTTIIKCCRHWASNTKMKYSIDNWQVFQRHWDGPWQWHEVRHDHQQGRFLWITFQNGGSWSEVRNEWVATNDSNQDRGHSQLKLLSLLQLYHLRMTMDFPVQRWSCTTSADHCIGGKQHDWSGSGDQQTTHHWMVMVFPVKQRASANQVLMLFLEEMQFTWYLASWNLLVIFPPE